VPCQGKPQINLYKKFPKNIIFLKGFLPNRGKKVIHYLKS
jgi:hypothetical protein